MAVVFNVLDKQKQKTDEGSTSLKQIKWSSDGAEKGEERKERASVEK